MTDNPKIKNIDPEKYYSATHIVMNGWTFWTMVLSFTRFLRTDEGQRLYRPVQVTRGAVNRYKILGANIIETLKAADEGTLKITHSNEITHSKEIAKDT